MRESYLKYPLNPEDKMHILQPKHTKLSQKESEEILKNLNVSKSQLPKIISTDAALPEGCVAGEMIKIERKEEDDSIITYYRVVV
jgi:DNA-directed RNA polymerase subunit H